MTLEEQLAEKQIELNEANDAFRVATTASAFWKDKYDSECAHYQRLTKILISDHFNVYADVAKKLKL